MPNTVVYVLVVASTLALVSMALVCLPSHVFGNDQSNTDLNLKLRLEEKVPA